MKKLFSILVILVFSFKLFGQDNKTVRDMPANMGIALGYNFYHAKTIELGIGIQPIGMKMVSKYGNPLPKSFFGFIFSYDSPTTKDTTKHISSNIFIMAQPSAIGLNINYHYYYSHKTIGIKPMIGLSYRFIAIMWGYNFFVTKNHFDNLKHNEWTIRTYIPIVNFKKK